MTRRIDLGSGFWYSYFQYAPDWTINVHQPGTPKQIKRAGITIWRLTKRTANMVADRGAPKGMVWKAVAACWFDTPRTKLVRGDQPAWQLISLTPLHIEPSIQMYDGQDKDGKPIPSYHGFIRNGLWVPA